MNHSCIDCKYKYEPISISDYYEKTLRIPGCDWSDPALRHTFWLCQNENNSPIMFVNNKPVLKRCVVYNSFGTCPFFQTSDAINITPSDFFILGPDIGTEIFEGDEVILSIAMKPEIPEEPENPTDPETSVTLDIPTTDPEVEPQPEPEPEPEPPAPKKSIIKYQWYRDGRKLFKERKGTLVVDTKKAGDYFFHCVVTEAIEDNGDGGTKIANVTTSSFEVIVKVKEETPEPPVPGV